MSSINTNAAAMTALQTLKATNKNMDITQNRISTGFRVSEASHNAAYWSIATTMRSDNKAMSTVQDALGLGAAQVDVAYTAMDASKDILDEIKKKLVAASQPGVDKAKVQSEIKELQSSLKSLADSASFSGGNWLSIDSTASNYKATESVVAAFTRSENGAITLGKVDVPVGQIALFDAGGAGLLEKAEGIDNTGVLAESGTTSVTTVAGAASSGQTAVLTTGNLGLTDIEADDILAFTIHVNGEAYNFSHTFAAGDIEADDTVTSATIAGLVNTFLATQTDSNGVGVNTLVTAGSAGDTLTFTSAATGAEQTLQLSAITYTDDDSVGPALAGSIAGTFVAVAEVTGADTGGTATAGSVTLTNAFEATTFDEDDFITFTLNLDGTDHNIRIDKATVDAALGSAADGAIASLAEYETVLTRALQNANITVGAGSDIVIDITSGNVVLTSGTTGDDSAVKINNLRHSSGAAAFDLLELDITTATNDQLAGYIQGLDDMLSSVITAASDLGAIKTRIDMQTDFVSKLMDALDRGIGQLVDADMEEESTRLQALQVQQQLGIQALSIANANTQNILSLFRG